MRVGRAIALLTALALLAAACGDDDTTADETTDQTDTSTAAETSTTAAPTTTAPATTTTSTTTAPLDGEQVLSDAGIPLPENASVVAVAEPGDDQVLVGANVATAPPPEYAALLDGTDWEVIDVVFGSEATVAFNSVAELCLLTYADYLSPSELEFWIWFWMWTGLADSVSCSEVAFAAMSAASEFGAP